MKFVSLVIFMGLVQTAFAENVKTISLTEPLKMELPVPSKNGQAVQFKILKGEGVQFNYSAAGDANPKTQTLMKIVRLNSVKTREDIFKKFDELHHRAHPTHRGDFKIKGAVTEFKSPAGKVIAIDELYLGYEPPSTQIYVLSKDGKGALYLGPTDSLNFDWAKLSVRWK